MKFNKKYFNTSFHNNLCESLHRTIAGHKPHGITKNNGATNSKNM